MPVIISAATVVRVHGKETESMKHKEQEIDWIPIPYIRQPLHLFYHMQL